MSDSVERKLVPVTSADREELDAFVERFPDLSVGLYFLLKLGLPFYRTQVDCEPTEGTNTFAVRYELSEWLQALLITLRATDWQSNEAEGGTVIAHKKPSDLKEVRVF